MVTSGAVSDASVAMQPSMRNYQAIDQDRLEALGLPLNYVAMTCLLCKSSSLDKCPFESKDTKAWLPLLPWYQGTRHKPAGRFCRTPDLTCLLEGLFRVDQILTFRDFG